MALNMPFLLHIRHAFWLIQFHLIIKNESKIIKMEKRNLEKLQRKKLILEKHLTEFGKKIKLIS